MEYCSGGDLAAFIRQRRSVSEVEARALMQQLAAGLHELWSRNLVHVRMALPSFLWVLTAMIGCFFALYCLCACLKPANARTRRLKQSSLAVQYVALLSAPLSCAECSAFCPLSGVPDCLSACSSTKLGRTQLLLPLGTDRVGRHLRLHAVGSLFQ